MAEKYSHETQDFDYWKSQRERSQAADEYLASKLGPARAPTTTSGTERPQPVLRPSNGVYLRSSADF